MRNRSRWSKLISLACYSLAAATLATPPVVAEVGNRRLLAEDYPLPELSLVLQSKPNSCGPAAIATLASWLGNPTSEESVLAGAALGEDGVTLAEFSRLADRHGLPGAWYRIAEAELRLLPAPFVAHLQGPEGAHFVVVRAIEGPHVLLADPASGSVSAPLARLTARFSGRVYLPRGRS